MPICREVRKITGRLTDEENDAKILKIIWSLCFDQCKRYDAIQIIVYTNYDWTIFSVVQCILRNIFYVSEVSECEGIFL